MMMIMVIKMIRMIMKMIDHGGHDHRDKDTWYEKSCSKVNAYDHSPGQVWVSKLKSNDDYDD